MRGLAFVLTLWASLLLLLFVVSFLAGLLAGLDGR